MMYDVKGKRVLVVGMVRSGIALARLLNSQGAAITLSDLKSKESLSGLSELEAELGSSAAWSLSSEPDSLLPNIDLAIISPGVPIQSSWIEKAKARGIPVIGELEYGASIASQLSGGITAVTGTNGKTTTTTLIGEMLKGAGRVAHVVGNIGDPVSGASLIAKRGDSFVIEVSSFQMESAPTFRPNIGALLNITPDHLNRHGDMATYIGLKKHMFANQTASDTSIVNADDILTNTLLDDLPMRKLKFSRKTEPAQGAFLRGGEVILRADSAEKTLCRADEIRIPGAHNLENAMAAICAASAQGVPPPVIRHTLRTFAGVEHRIETIRTLEGVTYINDSKGTNVDSTIKAVEAMTKPTVIILGGYDKHVSFDELSDVMVKLTNIKSAVLIGDVAAQIRASLEKSGFTEIHDAGYDFEKAIAVCRGIARDGWNVLLSPACASFDMFKDYEHRGHEFKRIVAAL
ncbi:MAG: UDP-N-acetylmuramoyl-L-alanine--D-glutamate ligase [Oscillospiraceae bacterium]|jgi:UDP-N-acetylmuramoylalanine--D-glutamate ligase|nr:UDP-N-acetylmuramoyl-L-alanine--D-glutamate ligase [Oscillospiraceae bacterium]